MTSTNKSFFDKLMDKAEELELQRKAEDLVDAAAKLATQAVEKAGDLAHENRDKVEGMLDKAAAKVDEQTDGRYADKVAKARTQVSHGVDKLAEQRSGSTPAGSGGDAAPTQQTPPAQQAPPTDPWSDVTGEQHGHAGSDPTP